MRNGTNSDDMKKAGENSPAFFLQSASVIRKCFFEYGMVLAVLGYTGDLHICTEHEVNVIG